MAGNERTSDSLDSPAAVRDDNTRASGNATERQALLALGSILAEIALNSLVEDPVIWIDEANESSDQAA